ncbi:MAG: hypothetical protein ACOCXA_08610 [Planctomycetota bacterium]
MQDFAYYERDNPARPFASRGEAARGVTALRGTGPEHCAQLLRTRAGYALLLLRGQLEDASNAAILDSFQVHPRPGYTGRALQSGKGRVIDASGRSLSARQVRAEDVEWSQAWEVETRHYHLTCSVSAERALSYAALLETLYDTYAGVFRPDTEPDFKIEVHVMHDEAQYHQVLGGLGVHLSSGMIGMFIPELLGMFIFDDTSRYTASAESVLAHESSHHFLHVTCNGSAHVPTWINEGLAVYFEAGEYGPRTARWQAPMDRLRRLKALYRQTERPLRALDSYLDHYGHITSDQYAEVYAMTHFWVFGSNSGRERFHDYWHALKAGENGTTAFERIFMQDLIRTHGSREAACQVWADALVRYVLAGKPEQK